MSGHPNYCKPMQDVLTHMAYCKQIRDCTVQHCLSSRQILLHYKTCQHSDCIICFPFRKNYAFQKNNPNAVGGGVEDLNKNVNHQQQQQQ